MRFKWTLLLTALYSVSEVSGTGITGNLSSAGTGKNSFISGDLIIGLRGGINFSQPIVIHGSEVIQGYDPASPTEKDYGPIFANIGYHYAFVFMFYLKESLSLSIEPAFADYTYRYELTSGWTNGTDPTDYIEYSGLHKNSISYLELPVVLRYEFRVNKLQPFLSLGLTYGFKINAMKTLESSVTRNTGAVSIPYENTTQSSTNSSSYIHSRIGIAPGIGFFYPLGPVKLMVSADFNFGLNNITDESNRYANSSVSAGMYDVQDDLRLGVLSFTVGVLFNTGSNNGSSGGNRQGGKAVECITFKNKRK